MSYPKPEKSTMRLSIDITPEQHQRLKAVAALQGQSMKDYVLNRVLRDIPVDDAEAIRQLEAFLEPRIKAAQGKNLDKSVMDIFKDAVQKAD